MRVHVYKFACVAMYKTCLNFQVQYTQVSTHHHIVRALGRACDATYRPCVAGATYVNTRTFIQQLFNMSARGIPFASCMIYCCTLNML